MNIKCMRSEMQFFFSTSCSCEIKTVANALLLINKPVSVHPFKKVVLSFCQCAKQVAPSESLGLCPYALDSAFSGRRFFQGALQYWLTLTEHESLAAVACSSRQ